MCQKNITYYLFQQLYAASEGEKRAKRGWKIR